MTTVPTEIVEVSVVVFAGIGMIATTDIVEVRVVVACDDAGELFVVGLGTGERGVKKIGEVADEREEIVEEGDKVEVSNGSKLTRELDRLDVEVGLEDVVVDVEVVVEKDWTEFTPPG
ncbi:hypothetical protein MMC34_002963 [Xylographa carneopallida]|nr:hypothetical protein [Xylographa carneopallida]